MNQSRPHPLVVSLLINLVLFSAVLALGFPIFNSGDDVYLLYLLGGGFGQAPTELLHYNYGMHPYLGWVIKNLFVQSPGFNWYATLLYLFHFISCTVLLWQWMRRSKFVVVVVSYALVFFIIEARFLLQPSFTNTALVTAIGGMLLFYDALRQRSVAKLVLGYVLLLAAAMLRLHLLIPAIVLSAPFFFLKFRKTVAIHAAGLAVLLTGLIFLQQQYYNQHIPGWAEEEAYRQTVINYYNTPKKSINTWGNSTFIAADLIEHGLLWDKTLLSTTKISEVTKAVEVSGAWRQHDFKGRLYWLMLESRIGIVLMLLFLFYKMPAMNKQERKAVVAAAVLLFGMCGALLLFRKLPPYVIPGGLLIWFAFAGTTGGNQASTKRSWLFAIAGALLLAWGISRLYKLNNWNKQQHLEFTCAYNYVAASPSKLFIAISDNFPMDFFHVWSRPHQYPLSNLLYKDHFLNNTYSTAFAKFNITSPQQLINNKTIIFTGTNPSIVCKYYELKSERIVSFLPADSSNCIQTWYIVQPPLTSELLHP